MISVQSIHDTLLSVSFSTRPFQNKEETSLYGIIAEQFSAPGPAAPYIARECSYGAMFSVKDIEVDNSIRYLCMLRADFAIISHNTVSAVIELHGTGHYKNDDMRSSDVKLYDEVRQHICNCASVPLFTIPPDKSAHPELIRLHLQGLILSASASSLSVSETVHTDPGQTGPLP